MTTICHIASGHYPDDDRIFYKEARSLAKAGYEVHVVAPFKAGLPPEKDGVRFNLVPRQGRVWGRLRNLFRIYKVVCGIRPQVCHCHEPDSLLVGVLLSIRHGTKLVFDSHELWSGVVEQRLPGGGIARLAARAYGGWERRLVRRCDAVIGATSAITAKLAAWVGPGRAETLLNVPAVEVFEAPRTRPPEDRFVFCHDGSLTFDRGLKVMAEAARQLSGAYPVVFRIVGDAFNAEREWLEAFIKEHHLEQVIQRTGWLPYEKVGAALAECHLGLVAFTRKPNHVIAAPNKIFNYLLYGLPFIGPDFMVELQKMAVEDGCCLLADCASSSSLAQAIEALLLDKPRFGRMVQSAHAASLNKYRWQYMETRLLALYRKILSDEPSAMA